MTKVHPAVSAEPGQWLLRHDVEWSDLVRYGPPGFAAYVRVPFAETAVDDAPTQSDALRTALATMTAFTATPADGFVAVWEGWGGGPAPQAPRLEIPHRSMLLFRGPVAVLRDAPALAWHGSAAGIRQEPHLVWPEDRAWCLACEVDEEVEFTVGCSDDAARALARVLPGVRRVAYGESAPL